MAHESTTIIEKSGSTIIELLDVSSHAQYMGHEKLYKIHNNASNVTAFVGIHNTALGPSLGGIRFKHYDSEDEAIHDVLRLSEAMTWKNAAGGIPFGGGKSVIMAPEGSRQASNDALNVFAEGLNAINAGTPSYFGAKDMNISEANLDHIKAQAPWIKGGIDENPDIVSDSPSPLTAIGVFECMKVAIQNILGQDSAKGIRVSMQGLGDVGGALAKHLHEDGAILMGADISAAPFEELQRQGVKIERVGPDDIYDQPADIFAPNAIGGTLNENTLPRLKAAGVKVICGAANNQQDDQSGNTQSKQLHDMGILYCPDYIVNAGGVIWVAKYGENAKETEDGIREGVPRRFADVLKQYSMNGERDMASIASQYAKERVDNANS